MVEETGDILSGVNTCSRPSALKITDMRLAEIDGAPKHCILLKLLTNQGLVGYGEIRDASSKTYALMLKSRLLGENPCNVEKLFRRIRQFGGQSRQGGGVSGVETALWDLAGKAYGVPVYQLLGGRYRDRVRMYCDTDVEGRHTGADMGEALKKRMAAGFTFLKMDLGIGMLFDEPGALCAPAGVIDDMRSFSASVLQNQRGSVDLRRLKRKNYEVFTVAHPFTGIHVTEKGLDLLEAYVAQVRGAIGWEIPLALDHIGHLPAEDIIRFARRMEKYSVAWIEDPVPWQYTAQYTRIAQATAVPLCTGEDIYLHESFGPLLRAGGVSVVHPDILTCGGIMECKKIGDLAEENGVAMAIHMAESPVACMAAVHCAAATKNFLALEFHSADVPWWGKIARGLPDPLIRGGFIDVPEAPGLGIESLDDDMLASHLYSDAHGIWEPTDAWNVEAANDRLWS